MKRFYFSAALLLCAVALFAQDYKIENGAVVFTRVYENTGKTIGEMHKAMEAYFARAYNDVNSTEKLNQQDHFIYKGMFVKTGVYQMGMWTIDVPHTIDVSIKENRMRVQIIVTTGIYRSLGSSPNKSEYQIAAAAPFEVSNNARFLKKESTHTFEVVQARCNDIFADIENSINNSTTDEDW